jgi:signal transduction histidine kinase
MKSLVLELLDAARTEQGPLVGQPEPVDLVAVAEATCDRYRSAHHPCSVRADAPVVGSYDPDRIEPLLENLVENAVKYSPAGGPVEIKLWQADGENHLTVTDHGIGIVAADLPRMFDRFHRGTNVDDRSFAGMGLGLYICRGIAEQHGGRITVESRPQHGSTFHVTLPATAPLTPVAVGGPVDEPTAYSDC